MKLVFTLKRSENAGTPLVGNGEFIAIVPIGYCSETGDVFSIFAALSPSGGDGPGEFEFVFNITRADADTGEVVSYWDGSETLPFFPLKSDRRTVFDELCEVLRALIGIANPVRLTMITHTRGLPRKALLKFQKLAIVMREEGFDARRVDPMNGTHMWIASR